MAAVPAPREASEFPGSAGRYEVLLMRVSRWAVMAVLVGTMASALWALAAASRPADAAVQPMEYHVGPGQEYERVVDVPWEALGPGDTVYLHWRSPGRGGDYHEKINLTRSGAPGKPIRIIGVKGPGGERPTLNPNPVWVSSPSSASVEMLT